MLNGTPLHEHVHMRIAETNLVVKFAKNWNFQFHQFPTKIVKWLMKVTAVSSAM
jgi:hypothetical protein